MNYKLAWRNIWRNRRRTIITMASVFLAVFVCVYQQSMTTGMFNKQIDNTLATQTGHIQIHGKGYWDDKVIDNFMFMDAETIAALDRIDNIANVSPRVETFAMAASDVRSKGVAVMGISPEKEAQKSHLNSRIEQGEYLSENDDGIILGKGLADYLKVTAGDTLALIGQGYHGSSAAGLFPVRGILKKQMTAEMDNALLYMTLPSAQNFIDMPDGYSGILIAIDDNKRLDETIEAVREKLPVIDKAKDDKNATDYEVYSWHFTMERMLQTAEADKAMGKIMLFVLYIIVGFGILGTVIMMTIERRREFSVMISLGMSRVKLALVTSIELLINSLMGVLLAFVISFPLVYWFSVHPIPVSGGMAQMLIDYGMEPVMPTAVEASIFINQIIIVFVIALIAMIYPVRKIMRLKIANNKK